MIRPETGENVFIAEGARLHGDVVIGENCSIWYNAVIRSDEEGRRIRIGRNTNVQDNCVLHVGPRHNLTIGEGVTIGHTAIVHGCTVGNNTLIGMGAIVMNGAVIGNNCIVGAGALVTENTQVPDGSLILGTPAKIRRLLTEEEIERNRISAQHYVEMGQNYRREQEEE